jgi:hypothetical protein
MNNLSRELKAHAEILEFFKGLPCDLKKHTLSFHQSKLPSVRCPCCQLLHYPLFCYHYCKHNCYSIALKQLVLHEHDYFFWSTLSASDDST